MVVDDGSRDDPRAVTPTDPRIRWVRQPPRGIARALEAGRRLCRGEWIARLDADDLALPGRIEAQLRALRADPGLAVVGGRARLRGPVGEGMARFVEEVNGLLRPEQLLAHLLVDAPLHHPAVLLRARALEAVGGYQEGDFPEDYDLWLRLVRAGHRLANVEAEVVSLVDRPERLTRTDPRYRRDAFEALKRQHLALTLPAAARLAVWGAGRTGRRWLRWLSEQGRRPVLLIDPFARGERQGLSVQPEEALREAHIDLVLVAVGARGARTLIARRMGELRPDLRPGEGWLALA